MPCAVAILILGLLLAIYAAMQEVNEINDGEDR